MEGSLCGGPGANELNSECVNRLREGAVLIRGCGVKRLLQALLPLALAACAGSVPDALSADPTTAAFVQAVGGSASIVPAGPICTRRPARDVRGGADRSLSQPQRLRRVVPEIHRRAARFNGQAGNAGEAVDLLPRVRSRHARAGHQRGRLLRHRAPRARAGSPHKG
jgi:hypothetical protein